MNKFQTSTLCFRQMEFTEIKELEAGDEIVVCINMDLPNKVEFIRETVVRPLFWNSNADEPDWEIETDNGFVDVYSVYEVN